MSRAIIQISVTDVRNVISTQCNVMVVALCDDGTVWDIQADSRHPIWRPFPSIPQGSIEPAIEEPGSQGK